MNKDIKEILDRLNDSANNPIVDVPVMGGVSEPIDNSQCLEPNECKILLDYITNLQEENKFLKLNNPEMNIEHFRVIKENKRKINNLRAENKKLKKTIVIMEKYLELIHDLGRAYNTTEEIYVDGKGKKKNN